MAILFPIDELGIDDRDAVVMPTAQRTARGPTVLFAWELSMKKFAIAAVAAAGLLTLGACGKKDDNAAAQNLEAVADNLDEAADNATTENGEAVLENAADNMHAMADNAADATATGATDNPAVAANVAAGNAMGH